jgi:Zn-dependent peptidase ImmA (M78 family)
MAIEQGVPAILDAIRASLRVTTADLRGEKTGEAIFAGLRKAVEAQGGFVLLVGDLGSHHTAIDVRTFRGFAIADRIAPLIVVNDKDAKTASSFTLLHGMAHLWLGASGVSGSDLAGLPIEHFCNEVASAFLLSREELLQLSPEIANQPSDPDAVMKLVIRLYGSRTRAARVPTSSPTGRFARVSLRRRYGLPRAGGLTNGFWSCGSRTPRRKRPGRR